MFYSINRRLMTNPGLQLINLRTSEVVVRSLTVADSFWTRFSGLQLRQSLEPGAGMILVPCRGVHTFFMRFPLDLVMLSVHGTVVGIAKNITPWKTLAADSQTHAVLEVMGGSLGPVLLGDRIALRQAEGASSVRVPRSLTFLSNP